MTLALPGQATATLIEDIYYGAPVPDMLPPPQVTRVSIIQGSSSYQFLLKNKLCYRYIHSPIQTKAVFMSETVQKNAAAECFPLRGSFICVRKPVASSNHYRFFVYLRIFLRTIHGTLFSCVIHIVLPGQNDLRDRHYFVPGGLEKVQDRG